MQGWQDDRTASLIFVSEGQSITLSLIADRPLAQELAHRLRAESRRTSPERGRSAGLSVFAEASMLLRS